MHVKSTTIKATVSWPSVLETRDRLVCERGRVGQWAGRSTNRPGKGTWDSEIVAEAAACSAGPAGRSCHAGDDGESIRWRNGATAYKGNKERQRQRIFIRPSPHSERRCFITGVSCKITLSRLWTRENLLFGQQGGQ